MSQAELSKDFMEKMEVISDIVLSKHDDEVAPKDFRFLVKDGLVFNRTIDAADMLLIGDILGIPREAWSHDDHQIVRLTTECVYDVARFALWNRLERFKTDPTRTGKFRFALTWWQSELLQGRIHSLRLPLGPFPVLPNVTLEDLPLDLAHKLTRPFPILEALHGGVNANGPVPDGSPCAQFIAFSRSLRSEEHSRITTRMTRVVPLMYLYVLVRKANRVWNEDPYRQDFQEEAMEALGTIYEVAPEIFHFLESRNYYENMQLSE